MTALPAIAEKNLSAEKSSPLQLCGQATLKAFKVFTVGESALYRPDCQTPWALDIGEDKLMYFRYARDIPASAFAESAMTMLDRNLQLTREQRSELERFHRLYRDVSNGDTYAMSYSEENGLQLFLNDTHLGNLSMQPLAHEYFSIWLGQKPFDENLKMDLLGK